MVDEVLELEVALDVPPETVRAWWLQVPDEYVAPDAREQPRRVVALARSEDAVEVRTYWRGAWGRMVPARQTWFFEPSGGWSSHLALFGFLVHVEFDARAEGAGTRLRVRRTITPVTSLSALLRPLLAPRVRRRVEGALRAAVRRCETVLRAPVAAPA